MPRGLTSWEESPSLKQQSYGLGFMILTSFVSLSKKKIRIKIVELENCYKGKKFTQSFQPLEMEVQEGLGRRDGRRRGQRGEGRMLWLLGLLRGRPKLLGRQRPASASALQTFIPSKCAASWLNLIPKLAYLSNLPEGCLLISPDCFY